MSANSENPYASPQTDVTAAPGGISPHVDPATLRKIEAVIKDAGQFWLAILLCILCSALGSLIIGPWYLVRLMQWQKLANEHPMLVDPGVPRGSIAQRFQSAKTKLIIGIAFGALMLALVAVYFLVLIVAGVS